jgi:hypothetical protein
MKCPFCEDDLKNGGDVFADGGRYEHMYCENESCHVFGEFTRYIAIVDKDEKLFRQEYSIGNFYVKVFPEVSIIYKMKSFLLTNEVRIPRALWLNPINTAETLDKLKFCVTFS